MATVMRDPVMLPSSKTIIDRATIKSHLLSDSKDPFNRAPLAIEDVIPGKSLCITMVFCLDLDFGQILN
jgi:ubiquitin conjugation factor E4 B